MNKDQNLVDVIDLKELLAIERAKNNELHAELEVMKAKNQWYADQHAYEIKRDSEQQNKIYDLTAELQQAKDDRFGVWALKEQHKTTWRDQPESYWFYLLMEEVGELGASLANDHKDPPEWEMKQVAAICLNWLEMRAALNPIEQEENAAP